MTPNVTLILFTLRGVRNGKDHSNEYLHLNLLLDYLSIEVVASVPAVRMVTPKAKPG